ncbi:MAG: glutamine synthetase, partial [Lachnospiraceae bacterium]|nr:glutamine synthetase [Lachnospiraceae bacterium]
RLIDEEDVEFIRLQFTDALGNLKNMAVTPGQLDRVVNNMYSFAGSAAFNDQYDFSSDLYLIPDLDTFVTLPWRPQQGKVAKLICDIGRETATENDDYVITPFEMSSRTILKNVVQEAEQKGYTFMINPECEFFLFHTDEDGRPTTLSHESAGYLDVGPADLGENARRDMVLALEEMGFEIESSHHEKAPGQHEIDYKQGESLAIADSVMTFKFAVRSIAKRFGLYATFMPKPVIGVPGSGMHINFSLYRDGKNLFDEAGKMSETAKYFVGGILEHAGALCAITNPTVNSYKRLLGGEGAPSRVTWSDSNNGAAVRFCRKFSEAKVEVRFPDPAANPYTAFAACIAAGLDGIERQVKPDIRNSLNAQKLPGNLNDALRNLKKDDVIRKALGSDFIDIYTSIRKKEWNEYMMQVSDWEISKYLVNI